MRRPGTISRDKSRQYIAYAGGRATALSCAKRDAGLADQAEETSYPLLLDKGLLANTP